ncbi:hypothetical protein PTKIN_Ptkin16aG0495400 [Pterospermum kingtungense]
MVTFCGSCTIISNLDLTLLGEAGEAGDVESLYNIIQRNAFILEQVDEVPFIDTPLHKAASAGNIRFAMEMMNLKPSFARKLNPQGFSPMHLALQNDRNALVLQLLKVDKSLVRVKGKEGITPFHYVTERGNGDLIRRFLDACPECITDVTVNGETALHRALHNDRVADFEAIILWLERQLYLENAENWLKEVVNCGDIEGNTVLHVAATKNQAQVVRRLLLTSQLNAEVTNSEGLTALGIIEQERNERQVNNDELRGFIRRLNPFGAGDPRRFMFKIMDKFQTLAIIISGESKRMTKEDRSAFLVVAGLVLTATYNASVNPPGGAWASSTDSGASMNTTSNHALNGTSSGPKHKAGTAIMDINHFFIFWIYNSTTFGATLMLVSCLLPSGYYSSSLLFSLYLLGLCYGSSLSILSPTSSYQASSYGLSVWFALTVIVMFLLSKYPFYNRLKSLISRLVS